MAFCLRGKQSSKVPPLPLPGAIRRDRPEAHGLYLVDAGSGSISVPWGFGVACGGSSYVYNVATPYRTVPYRTFTPTLPYPAPPHPTPPHLTSPYTHLTLTFTSPSLALPHLTSPYLTLPLFTLLYLLCLTLPYLTLPSLSETLYECIRPSLHLSINAYLSTRCPRPSRICRLPLAAYGPAACREDEDPLLRMCLTAERLLYWQDAQKHEYQV